MAAALGLTVLVATYPHIGASEDFVRNALIHPRPP
jgi:hypothetical protein